MINLYHLGLSGLSKCKKWPFINHVDIFGHLWFLHPFWIIYGHLENHPSPSYHVQKLSTWFMKIRPPPPNLQGRIYDPIWLKNICVSGTWITRPDFKKLILPKNCRIFITQFISNIKLSFISMLKIIKNWFNWLSKYIFWFRK